MDVMSKYAGIIARLEAAEGADRELDWRVAEALDIPSKWTDSTLWPPFMKGSAMDKEIPAFSSSIDAALALVERLLQGYWWRISRSGACEIHHPDLRRKDHEALAATPALAVLISLFRCLDAEATP